MFYSETVLKPVIRIFIAFVFVGYSQETCDSPIWGRRLRLRLLSPFYRLVECLGIGWSLACSQKVNYPLGWSLGWQAGSEIGQSLWGG